MPRSSASLTSRSASAGIAKILFAIFLVLFLGAVFIGLVVGKRLTR